MKVYFSKVTRTTQQTHHDKIEYKAAYRSISMGNNNNFFSLSSDISVFTVLRLKELFGDDIIELSVSSEPMYKNFMKSSIDLTISGLENIDYFDILIINGLDV